MIEPVSVIADGTFATAGADADLGAERMGFDQPFLGLGFAITGHYFRRTAMKARNHAFLFEKAQIGTDCRFRGSKYSRQILNKHGSLFIH